jgi:hypothetical protein
MRTWKRKSRLHFRATEPPVHGKAAALGVAALTCFSAGLAVGCERSTGGTATGALSSSSAAPRSDPAEPVPGVESTLREHIPPNALVCFPPPTGDGRLTPASVSDPVAPRITVPFPDGWNSVPGVGDIALSSTGPDGMSMRLTITGTSLDPGGAFLRYATALRTTKPGAKVTVAPAQFCGYSGQLLSGTIPGPAAVDFADRIAHIWTNTQAYLVAVHLEGPAGAPGFAAAKSTLMQQFAILIP